MSVMLEYKMKREPYESGKLSKRIRENFKYLTGEGEAASDYRPPACFCIAAAHPAAVIVWNICAVIFSITVFYYNPNSFLFGRIPKARWRSRSVCRSL